MGKFAKTSAPIGVKVVDLDAGWIAPAKPHNLNVDMSMMTEIKEIRCHIKLIFSLKLNGVYMPLTFLLTWTFALKAKAYLASLVQEASWKTGRSARKQQQKGSPKCGALAGSASIVQPRSHFLSLKRNLRKNKTKPKI